jgi:hypothetical protein
MKLKYLVVGTGRCGTVYMARVLTSMGIPCGHETIFDFNGLDLALARLGGEGSLRLSFVSQSKFKGAEHHFLPDWLGDVNKIVADSSYMAAPFLRHECLEGTKVIHVVRHPVKVINSFLNYLGYFQHKIPSCMSTIAWESFIYNNVPELGDECLTPEERAARYYVRWNRMIDESLAGKTHVRLRAEDGPRGAMDFVGYEGSIFELFNDKSVNTLRRPGKLFSLFDLREGKIKDELLELSESYGYNLRSEYMGI